MIQVKRKGGQNRKENTQKSAASFTELILEKKKSSWSQGKEFSQDRKVVTPGKAARQSPKKLPDKIMPTKGRKERHKGKV